MAGNTDAKHPWRRKSFIKKSIPKVFFTTGETTVKSRSNISNRELVRMTNRQMQENHAIRNGTKSKPIIVVEI